MLGLARAGAPPVFKVQKIYGVSAMVHRHRELSMGFTDRRFSSGVHICYLFGDDLERLPLVAKYITAGIRSSERALYLSDTLAVGEMRDTLLKLGADLGGEGQTTIRSTDDSYLPDGRFSADRMIGQVSDFFEASLAEGFAGGRGTGEMTWTLRDAPGVEDVMVYEARLNRVIEYYAMTAMCQYDLRRFDGATIMDVLRVHPYTVMRGQILENPYFISPEQFLREYSPRRAHSVAEARAQ